MSAQSTLTIADSWWVRVRCEAPGAPAQSQIVQSNDGFGMSLNTTVSPGQKIDCRVCFEPILNASAMGRELKGDYPECSVFSYTAPKECECFITPTNPGQGGASGGRTEKGAPCEGFSTFFDAGLGLVILTGPNEGGAYTAEGTAPDPGAYCTGCSGTRSRYDLCGCGNPPIEEEYDGTGGDPSYTDWGQSEDSVCAGTPFEQWRELAEGSCRACGGLELGPNPAVGTMLPDWSGWHPQTDLSQVCSDATGITQHRYDKNGCIADLEEQTVYGTKNCSCECPPGWSDAMPAFDVVTGEPCPEGETLHTAGGSGDNPCETCYKCECEVYEWSPYEDEVCEGVSFTQTGYGYNCTRERQAVGTKAPSWQGGTCANPVEYDANGCQPDRTVEPPPCCSEPEGCCSWRIIETASNGGQGLVYESGGAGTLPPSEWTPSYYDYEGYMELQRNCGNGWTTEQQWITQNGGPTKSLN